MMENVEKIYKELTGVDINEQYKLWDERGKGYYGEYLTFKNLYTKLDGKVKFLMNLQIPVGDERTTEIDLLMIHETGIYVFEIKHYKGTIYGKAQDKKWTQYFKTTKNNSFNNPILQNDYHISALRRMFPDMPIYSVIVFTSDYCDLRIENDNLKVIVTSLNDLHWKLSKHIALQTLLLDIDKMEELFIKLEIHSPIREKVVLTESKEELPFYEYVHNLGKDIKEELHMSVEKHENAAKNLKEQTQKMKCRWWIAIIVIVLVCTLVTGLICTAYKKVCDNNVFKAVTALQEMERRFQRVDINSRDNTQLINTMIEVSSLKLSPSKNMKNTVLFSCTITNTDAEYGIMFNENTSYVIHMANGTVREYAMFGERLKYSELANRLSGTSDKMGWKHSGELKELEIYDVSSTSDIVYIKLSNISLWKLYENGNKPLVDDLELELYSK